MGTDIINTIQNLNSRNFTDYKFLVNELREIISNISRENINVIRQDKDFEGYTFKANSLDYLKSIYNKKLEEFVNTFFWDEELIREEIQLNPDILKTIYLQSFTYLHPLIEQSLDAGLNGPSGIHKGKVSLDHFNRNYKSGHYLKPKQIIKSSDGCYVATFAYNSYEHKNVLILRNFRDEVLTNRYIGKVFIKYYYKYSPNLVRLFYNIRFPKLIIKSILEMIIFIITIKKIKF